MINRAVTQHATGAFDSLRAEHRSAVASWRCLELVGRPEDCENRSAERGRYVRRPGIVAHKDVSQRQYANQFAEVCLPGEIDRALFLHMCHHLAGDHSFSGRSDQDYPAAGLGNQSVGKCSKAIGWPALGTTVGRSGIESDERAIGARHGMAIEDGGSGLSLFISRNKKRRRAFVHFV